MSALALPRQAEEELDRRLAAVGGELMELGGREIGLDDLVHDTRIAEIVLAELDEDASDLASYVGSAQVTFVPFVMGEAPFFAQSDTDFVPCVARTGRLYVPDTLTARIETKSPDLPEVGTALLCLFLLRRWLDLRTDGAVSRMLYPDAEPSEDADLEDNPDLAERLARLLARAEDALVRAEAPYVQPPISYALLSVFVEAMYEDGDDDNALEVPGGTARGHFHGSVPQVFSGARTATEYARRLFSLDVLLARGHRDSLELPIRILDVLVKRFVNRTQLEDEKKKYLIVWYLLRLVRRYPGIAGTVAERARAESGVRRSVLCHVLSFLHADPAVGPVLGDLGVRARRMPAMKTKREVVEHLELELHDEYSARLLEVLQDLYIYEGSVEVMDRRHVIDAWEDRTSGRSWKGSLDTTRLLRIADVAADNPLFECAGRRPGEERIVYHPNQRYLYNSLRRVLGTHYVYRLLMAETVSWALKQHQFRPLSEGVIMIVKVMRTFRDRDDFERDRSVTDFFETFLPAQLSDMPDDEPVEYLRGASQAPLEPWELRETPTRMEDMRRLRFIADDEQAPRRSANRR